MKHLSVFVICIMLFSSCAKKVVMPYQNNSANTGSIKIKPSTSLKAASVTIDGNLLWDRKKKIKSITITNVPIGTHNVNVTSASWYYKEAVNHKETIRINSAGDNKAILVSVPPYSTGYWICCGVAFLVCLTPGILLL